LAEDRKRNKNAVDVEQEGRTSQEDSPYIASENSKKGYLWGVYFKQEGRRGDVGPRKKATMASTEGGS